MRPDKRLQLTEWSEVNFGKVSSEKDSVRPSDG